MKQKLKILASILVRHRGGILLLRRSRHFKGIRVGQGLWELPGGGLRFGQTLRGAAERELREETGLVLPRRPKFHKLIAYVVKSAAAAEHRINAVYRAKYKNALDGNLQLGEEHDDYRIVTKAEELKGLKMVKAVKKLVREELK